MHQGKKGKRNLRGFTLVELIVSLAIFLIMLTTLTATFVSGFASFRNSRDLQQNVESAQYAMNTLSKYLRTGTIITSSASDIVFYDYSSSRCLEYQISGNALRARTKGVAAYTSCSTAGMGVWSNVTTGYVTGQFIVDSSTNSPKHMGRVTLYLDIRRLSTSTMSTGFQTSVSLRDYQYVGT